METLLWISPYLGTNAKVLYCTSHEQEIVAYFYDNPFGADDEAVSHAYVHYEIPLIKVARIGVTAHWLEYIRVAPNYQGHQIGSYLMMLAVERLHLRHIHCREVNHCCRFLLNPASARLIASCLRRGLISPNMCLFSRGEILEDYLHLSPSQPSHLVQQSLLAIDPDYFKPLERLKTGFDHLEDLLTRPLEVSGLTPPNATWLKASTSISELNGLSCRGRHRNLSPLEEGVFTYH